MQIFKNKAFHKWATKEGLTDNLLRTAVAEMEQGLIDADLGGNVFKKRVALPGQGKSSGLRTLLTSSQIRPFLYMASPKVLVPISVLPS